ncbi:MAG: hypothetical protein GYB66_02030 [Chloroflexi bacterium]|nr:hypothetical protein [Chloroflexota bacterium]
MPTPFTHLAKAQRLIDDSRVSSEHKRFLRQFWGAFLLGNIAPDAHHEVETLKREDTHFFHYRPRVFPPPEQAILDQHPEITASVLGNSAQAAFVAGYLAHLAVDAAWCEEVLFPGFLLEDWADNATRHFLFVTLLAFMDGRDYEILPPEHAVALADVSPQYWLPFLPDTALVRWRDTIVAQIRPGGTRQSLQIMGRTVSSGYHGLAAILDSTTRLDAELWSRYPPTQLAGAEETAYQRMCASVRVYLDTMIS